MPVRKIPISRRSCTGRQYLKRLRKGVPFESLLERDFLVLMDFDRDVTSVEEQPVAVHWQDERGRARRYTPDYLVHFREPGRQYPPRLPGKRKPWLIEVKYREDLIANWSKYRPVFRAATGYAARNGWTFHIMTDTRIRTPRLDNARVLMPFMMTSYDHNRCEALLATLEDLDGVTPEILLSAVTPDPIGQAMLLPQLWGLIAWRNIGANLSFPLSMKSDIWFPEYMKSRLDPQFMRP